MVRPVTQNWTGQEMSTRNPFGNPGHDGHDGDGSIRAKTSPQGITSGRTTGTPMPSQSVAPASAPTPGIDDASVCRLLSLLADKTRLKILKLLAAKERHVGALTAELGLPQPTVSHHLAWLRTVGLVSPRRQGKFVFYALGPAAEMGDEGQLSLHAADAVVTITQRKA
ncbi:MAG TPA: metalloregulator ArsR/SmtB family transcription factor [Tepidisphaeraceae bacterium]|nr:metalloregulator ArsR/SmtB family transcription factor [Tepidisphaeraceae bacterium]